MTSCMGYTQCQTYCILLTKTGGGAVQTYRHRLPSSGVGLSLQTNRSKHIGVTQLRQMPGLLPRASWRVYICQLLPSGPGSRLTSCRSWALPARLPQPCCTSGNASARTLGCSAKPSASSLTLSFLFAFLLA